MPADDAAHPHEAHAAAAVAVGLPAGWLAGVLAAVVVAGVMALGLAAATPQLDASAALAGVMAAAVGGAIGPAVLLAVGRLPVEKFGLVAVGGSTAGMLVTLTVALAIWQLAEPQRAGFLVGLLGTAFVGLVAQKLAVVAAVRPALGGSLFGAGGANPGGASRSASTARASTATRTEDSEGSR